jgi:hypothetical protein
MNDQDRDLIFALAQGDLSTTAAEVAVARIEADPELASEYADQVAALQFLHSAITPTMSAAERSTLHANLTEQLSLLPLAASAPATTTKKAQWWVPVFGLAAAAAVVAAFVIFPNSGQDTFAEVSADLGAETEATAPQSSRSPQTTAASGDSLDSASADAAATEELSSSGAPPFAEDDALSVYDTDSIALDELLAQADGADSPENIRRQLSAMSFKSTVDLDRDDVNACIEDLAAALPDGVSDILVIGADTDDEGTIVHLGFAFGEGIEDGLSFVLESCALIEHSSQG